MSEQFNARPFYEGAVFGLRAFTPVAGELLPPQRPAAGAWQPGVNEAVCDDDAAPWRVHRCPREPHQPASPGARCGFYAYFDGSNDYARSDRISGIVKGWGTVTVGHRGFQSSKARIVALIRPRAPVDRLELIMRWLRANGVPHGPEEIVDGSIVRTGSKIHYETAHRHHSGEWLRIKRTFPERISFEEAGHKAAEDRPVVAAPEVEARYPDVPWYDSEAEAIAAHPLTDPKDLGVEPPASDAEDYLDKVRRLMRAGSSVKPRFAQGGFIPPAASWSTHMHAVDVSGFRDAMKRAAVAAAEAQRTWEQIAAVMATPAAEVEAKLRQLGATMEQQPPADPIERKRQLAEQRAQQRARAGLSGAGGFDRRGRRR